MSDRRAWVVFSAAGLAAVCAVVAAVAPGCATHQCDTSSYDYYGGRMLDANTYETNDINAPWISYNGEATVHVHFPPGVYRRPSTISGWVGTSETPNGGVDFMGGDNLSQAVGQLAEEYFIDPTGFFVNNASCAGYFARFLVTFPPVTLTLFGGMGGGGDPGIGKFGDTWTWNGSQWTAAEVVSMPTTGPAPRAGITLATAGGSPFFFGGDEGNETYANDFWQWDGVTWNPKSWPCMAPDAGPGCIPPIPPPRAYAAFVTVPRRTQADGGAIDEILMFGGKNGPTTALADTWIWNGTDWTQANSAQSPGARWGAATAALDGKVILFGGTSDGKTPLGDMWQWDADAGGWNSMTTAGGAPSARFLASAATIGHSVVVFGGTDGLRDLGDTWVWDGANWTEARGSGPSPRSNAAMGAFSAPGAALLLFGGFSRDVTGDAALDDFWAWSGSDWSRVPYLGDALPPARGGAGIVGF